MEIKSEWKTVRTITYELLPGSDEFAFYKDNIVVCREGQNDVSQNIHYGLASVQEIKNAKGLDRITSRITIGENVYYLSIFYKEKMDRYRDGENASLLAFDEIYTIDEDTIKSKLYEIVLYDEDNNDILDYRTKKNIRETN